MTERAGTAYALVPAYNLPVPLAIGYPAAMADYHDSLNARAAALVREMVHHADELGIRVETASAGTTLIDCGIAVPGSREAALLLARVCLADLAEVTVEDSAKTWPSVTVSTKQPVRACLASQYAGWEINGEKFFAMGSGPMRAAAGREVLFDEIGHRETVSECVGVLESGKLPPVDVCSTIAAKCGVEVNRLTLFVAPTSSLCGTFQIVARSVETVLHKLHFLGFDLTRVISGRGTAPLPPLVKDDFAAIGRTNDAILYGAHVKLDLWGDDESLRDIGPKIPSAASVDYGRPFAEIMAHYNSDFYRIDPLLFSPAEIELVNIDTGSRFHFGELNHELLERSFA